MTVKEMLLLKVAAAWSADGTGRAIREQAEVPLKLIADAIGVTEGAVSRWETGSRRPRGENGVKWVQLLQEIQRGLVRSAA